ncbi:hypothetical protein [Butyrivibrio sp. INlla16]|uniref:hypothetical protein n=1 Tax=Butyrivibrio sp. INlla16 TaxID=1520807 RepID=UPI000882913E|nr:hypothetical protein [Butyrivibrio sp. INlla16]SDB54147.1 hypothetical protein SAMN02910263_02746 [Butyrivibrio sp. INlla16]
MFFEDDDKQYKLVAPDIDSLIRYFDSRDLINARKSTPELFAAMKPIFEILKPLAPIRKNSDVKALWLRIPRGTIDDYDSFEDMKLYGDVETYEEYEQRWNNDYPDEYIWYELVVAWCLDRNGELSYYGMDLGNERIIAASMDDVVFEGRGYYAQEAAMKLCELIIPAVKEAMSLLKEGKYNDLVEKELPYEFRTGVVKRSDIWSTDPETKEYAYDGLSEEAVSRFREMISSGVNDLNRIGRIKEFTANDFFKACKLGYDAIGKDTSRFSLSEMYMRFSDGRDEGLTGKGHGLNEGPGIDFEDPKAWDEWYYNREQQGGHPWEVVPGGNSTHMELYVCNDKRDLEWDLRGGEITEEEYQEKIKKAGYYFYIVGVHRQFESISFYLALSDAGLPVIIGSAEEMVASFDGSDYVGVVPHHMYTRYCSDLFPDEYGDIIDFTHVYKDEDAWFDKITWLPEEPAVLLQD